MFGLPSFDTFYIILYNFFVHASPQI